MSTPHLVIQTGGTKKVHQSADNMRMTGAFAHLAPGDEDFERKAETSFTTKPGDEAASAGLSVVYDIVEQSGGHIEVAIEPSNGTGFRL